MILKGFSEVTFYVTSGPPPCPVKAHPSRPRCLVPETPKDKIV